MTVKLTTHSIQRAKERFNLSQKVLRQYAHEALEQGVDVFSDPHLRPIFMNKIKNHPETGGIYYFQGMFFVYIDDSLATIYPLSFIDGYQK